MLRIEMLPRRTQTLLLAAAVMVSLVGQASAQSVAAKVIELSGQVSVLKDGYPQPLFKDRMVSAKQLVVTGPDGYAKFQVSDGSTFEVFPNAKVTFRDNYPSWTDLVQVWLGRIRVQIEHRNGPNPNRVSTPTAVISVRGTTFDVVVEDSEDTTLVSVEEGVVGVAHRLQPGSEIRINAGESVRVFRNQPLARVIDRTPAVRAVLNAAREAVYEIMLRRSGGGSLPSGGTGTTGQGDKGKTGDTGSTGDTTGAPGAPPAAPGAPPAGN